MKKNLTNFLLLFICGLFCNCLSAQNPFLSISNNSGYNCIEGNSISLRLTLSGAISAPVTVNVTTTTGTAGASDFTALTTTITIPAGQNVSSYFSIATTNDAVIEPNEEFTVKALVVSANTSNLNAQNEITIVDNDTPPAVIVTTQSTAVEGGISTTIYYSLSNVFNTDVIINCVTANGTAGATDFTAVNSTVTIPAGQFSGSKTLTITDDALVEPDETFDLNGTVTSGNTTNTALATTIKIIDNDTTPTLTVYDGQVIEGQTETVYATLDRTYNSNVVINFVTVAGTAGTADFTMTTITQTILAGNATALVSIPTINDALDEPIETFTVSATVTSGNTTNASVTSQIIINDNDGLPDFSVYHYFQGSPNQEGEGYEGDTAFFYLRLSDPSATDVVVHVVTSPGTASNTDFTPLDTVATIPAGEYGVSVSVPTTIDNLIEGTENFNFNATVTSGNTYNPSASTVADILDNYNIKTAADEFTFVAGMGTNLSVISNDMLHGAAVNSSDISITIEANTIGVTINAQGILVIPNSVTPGNYYLSYTACEVANPGICDTGYISLEIQSPLVVTFSSSVADSNGDGYTSAGDVVDISFTLTNIGNAPISNISPDPGFANGNITFIGGPIASLASGASDSTSILGRIVITQDDISYAGAGLLAKFDGIYYGNQVNVVIDSSFTINPSDGIRLRAFIDSNNNGVQDGIEPNFRRGNFDYTINGGAVHNIYCNSSYYLYESNPTTIYNLSYNIDTPYATYNTCTTTYPNVTVPVGSGITTYNFPIATTPFQELSAHLIPWSNEPRPGVVWSNYIAYSNNSNQPVASGTVTFIKDSAVTITNISQPGAISNAAGFIFNFANLAPYETRYMNVELLVPAIPTVALGQLLTSSVSITLPSGDIYPYNNNSSLTQAIVGSFDPNDITESHGEKILFSSFTSNDYLTYTIRFENTGTASAINIKIEDMLNIKLDPTTIRMIDSSAPYTLERVGANLVWKFNGINLPPSIADTRIGKGFITFQVKPKPGYAVGDIIPNSASIYFDTNPAIITNTFNTQFVNTLANEDFVFGNFSYYPNPVKNVLTVTNDSVIEEISITSILGQQILVKKVNSLQAEIDISSLSKGVYFVKTSSEGLEKTVKILKE
jgi:hypothetical protein